jgi:hypothetical protein
MLRVLTRDRKIDVRVGWRRGRAFIEGLGPETIVAELTANMAGRHQAAEFNWADSPRKISPQAYRTACLDMAGDERAQGFMAGWATDGVIKNGYIAPTRMDMTSGRQKLLKRLRALAAKITPRHLTHALAGGAYEGQSSFGLDPASARTHAHENKSPTKSKPPGKPGLIWLAFESIPLHPVFPVSGQNAYTTGWRDDAAGSDYVWPIWDGVLTLEDVYYLRTLPIEALTRRRGVREIWSSHYGSSGKFGIFLPAHREQ